MKFESASFHNVSVYPFTGLLDNPRGGSFHKGGPDWPEWDGQVIARHNQWNRPVDERPAPETVTASNNQTAVWGGPIVKYFGHQIGDFSMRLLSVLHEMPNARIAFASKKTEPYASVTAAPRFFGQILEWLGVASVNIILIREPTLFLDLTVYRQCEQLGIGPSEKYLNLLDDLVERRKHQLEIKETDILFVSRANQKARFAGEAYVEAILNHCGCKVIRPETLMARL